MADHFRLYCHYYSLCSVMVRFSNALVRPFPKERLQIEEQIIDIQHGGQLTEEYLCEINHLGTVPVLAGKTLERSLTDSLDITVFLAERYLPTLMPTHIADQSRSLLEEIHDINYFSLTYTHKEHRVAEMQDAMKAACSNPDMSDRHRKALEDKLQVAISSQLPALSNELVVEAEEKTLKLLAKLEQILMQSEQQSQTPSPWLFGTQEATALDGHVVPFLARLLDVGRGEMLGRKDSRLHRYVEAAYETEAWKEIVGDRTTVYAGF
ncbi:uncharacterized protein A1O9_02237 [Exophiala aquamarina CBS 119918]|uniref:GST N-terminal domain-containing protein n=1 Tax=Exophiala aquamarina CBS 119918 TaxID=1182545 RepID=A0A072PLC0_9EURO|nr:uncharacterized protein A1O9_02237 [Exophiala aquamarina CBS 119918]KEF60676.1 hypothetical protein A1O9_02237 [Exophiala aquamarina CBS 119918]